MKETDFNLIRDEIQSQLDETEYDIVDIIGTESVILCVMGIYLSNDLTTAYGQDFAAQIDEDEVTYTREVSVISTPEKITIITSRNMSFYKENLPICGYESLSEDISNILIIIQTVIDRINSNNP